MINFLTENSIYLVLFIALIIWVGLGGIMLNLNRKINKLENDFQNMKDETP